MYHKQDSQLNNPLQDPLAQGEARDLDRSLIPTVAVGTESSATNAMEGSGGEIPSSPQSSQRASIPPTVMGSIEERSSAKGSGHQVEQREQPVFLMHGILKPK